MQEIKTRDIDIDKDECLICFEDGFFLKCKAVGTRDFIFTGQIIPILDRFDFVSQQISFSKDEILIFSDQFSDVNTFIKNVNNEQIIILPDKIINVDEILLQKKLLEKNFLIIYDISFEILSNFLQEKNIHCGVYFSSQKKTFNIDYIYKKFSFLQKINDFNLNNSNITQYIKKYKKYKLSIFRKKAIIIDLGIGSEDIKDFFVKDYDVFILNIHTDIEVINDINPSLVAFSDGFCNPNLVYKTMSNLVNFCINSKIKIYGFGCGFFIIAIAIGIKCRLIGFNCKDNYIFNYKNQFIKNRFFYYFCLDNIESKKIINKLCSIDKKRLYGLIYEYNDKKIFGINNIENFKYL